MIMSRTLFGLDHTPQKHRNLSGSKQHSENPTEASLLAPPITAGMSAQVLNVSMTSPLDIPGSKDDAVKDYVQYL